MNQEIDINLVLGSMRETIGTQAQEIAILKATIATLTPAPSESDS